ncbi:unnamed protein product (macronuclear) [Paramecium tetraurelia]|uniref:FCP1 homology domain-containing protein n=1 Tax=Paramecium tetraurelia TaxID=5888 RepID=A0DEE2_PARTE|nr:uncharacterized protein GSPATT00016235001 [Paramecium tetraurelia]CAK81409.1 unnamed protein product [Paramecium tetraurelia]|eukprot:XP_001448806.1 hypothetical protein (macronuclear) [Paramecium tetraurelia strain d4-2]
MKPKPQIETNNVFDILQKASQNLKTQKLDLINSVRNMSTKSSSNGNIFGKEFLKQQFCRENQQKKKQMSNLELVAAMQKYNQLLQHKRDTPTRNYSKSQSLLNQLVTKVTPNLEMNMFKQTQRSPMATDVRPKTSDLKAPTSVQHKRQQSIGSKDQNYKKLYNAMLQKPKKAQSHQTTPQHSRQLSLQQSQQLSNRESKFFESTKFNKENKENSQFQYYLGKIRQVFTRPLRDDYFSCIYREHFFQTYQGIYVASYLRPVDPNDVKKKAVQLRQKDKYKNKISLIFDLDETLVHCNESLLQKSDIVLNIQVSPNEIVKAGVNIRPGAIELLESLVDDFEIIVFTASHSCYAQQVLDYLDPEKKLISHRLFRDNCIMTTGGMYTKDLRIFDRQLSQIVLIDNAAYSYAWQLDNGIPIVPFYDNKDDRELWGLQTYLSGMIGVSDVREYNREKLKLNQFFDSQGPASVFEKLFQQKIEI